MHFWQAGRSATSTSPGPRSVILILWVSGHIVCEASRRPCFVSSTRSTDMASGGASFEFDPDGEAALGDQPPQHLHEEGHLLLPGNRLRRREIGSGDTSGREFDPHPGSCRSRAPPVKVPRTCPRSSLSGSVSGNAAQFTAMKGRPRWRRLPEWMARRSVEASSRL